MTLSDSNNNIQQMQLDIATHEKAPSHGEDAQQPLAPDASSRVSTPLAAIRAVSSADDNNKTERHRDPRYLKGVALAASAFLVLLIASQQSDDPAPARPANFAATALSPAPEIHRTFREIAFNDSGEVLQLGLFRQLNGAETQQTRLASIGLLPYIEKRVDSTGTKYAVMIGPLDAQAHERALTKLDDNNVAYFHTTKIDIGEPLDRLVNGRSKEQTDAQGS